MKKIFIPLAFILLFTALIFPVGNSMRESFEYNVDEGMDLMVTSLFFKGFSLYERIWNDQPPLFYIMLSHWFKFLSPSVFYARVFILIFSLILLWAFYKTIEIEWGSVAAFIGVIGLLFSSFYLHLSTSVMIGTVAISLAMLSIYFIKAYRKTGLMHFLILSAVFMALSMLTKLFTAFLIPLFILEIVFANKERKRSYLQSFLFLGSLSLLLLGVISYFFHTDFRMVFQQLVLPHFYAKLHFPDSDWLFFREFLLADYAVVLLALAGVILLIFKKKWRFFFPVGWLILIAVVLAIHRPIYYHYYPFVSLPVCWLSAIGVKELLSFKKSHLIRWLTITLIALFIFRLPVKWTRMVDNVRGYTSPEHAQIMNLLFKYRPITHWMFTDRPIFAFYANIPVPPELAIITEKRGLQSNKMRGYLKHTLQRYNPELILLNQMQFYGPEVISYIKENYALIYQNEIPEWNWSSGLGKFEKRGSFVFLLLRKDIAKNEDKN
ncbi:MAG: glycosyltransferase family 39 protein [Candidatus Omnitrophica bacterium]|nr:glycosyltransferase family 39 protein [Candidatus Omnitrophota bacterium]